MADRDFGAAWLVRSIGFWWRYDLTTGSAWSRAHLGRVLRFYGVTIGQCCIGILISRKEKERG